MELQHVEVFLVLAEELHFGRTAERLRFTQPRVSRLVAALEREVGGTLFERTSRRVRLTPLGGELHRMLLPAFRELVAAVDQARVRARGTAGLLRLGFSATTEGVALNTLVAAFEARYPDIQVVLHEVPTFDPYQPLRQNEIDATFNWLVVDEEPDLVAGPAVEYREPVLAVAKHHPLADKGAVSIDDIAEYETPDPDAFPQSLWNSFLPPRTPSGRPMRRTRPVSSMAEIVAHVALGRVVHATVTSVSMLDNREDIVLIPIAGMPPIGVGPIWCAAHENARLRALGRVAAEIASRQPPGANCRRGPSDPRPQRPVLASA